MSIETDYTAEANKDTLTSGAISAYRVMYWMVNVLQNFFSDPMNIKDNRLQSLLWVQDKEKKDGTGLHAAFDIGAAYSPDVKKANTTPMIVVAVGDTTYGANGVNLPGAALNGINSYPMFQGQKLRMIPLKISVTTESYAGTLQLTGLIEDFLCSHEKLFTADNKMLSAFIVQGSTAPQKAEDEKQSKDVFVSYITIQTAGAIGFTVDTQGPVFRGIRTSVNRQ